MPTTIVRDTSVIGPIALTNNVATTAGFSLSLLSGAVLMVDSVAPAATATLRFHIKADSRFDSTYLFTNGQNSPVEVTIQAGRALELPDALFAARYVMPVLTAGSASVVVSLKA